MALEEYQVEIELATLYRIRKKGGVSGIGEQILPTIEIIGGTADVYVSQTEPETAPTGMTIIENGEGVVGTLGFAYVPAYIYVNQNTGTTTSIVLSCIEAEVVV